MNETFIVPRGICFALKRATLNISTDKLMIKKIHTKHPTTLM